MQENLDKRSERSKTTKLWVDCLIKHVLIMMAFVRAVREGDWHLYAVEKMLPYFFASSHVNYARYGLCYLRSMQRLPRELPKSFLAGEHVMRHQDRLWNGIWSDHFIESTYTCGMGMDLMVLSVLPLMKTPLLSGPCHTAY